MTKTWLLVAAIFMINAGCGDQRSPKHRLSGKDSAFWDEHDSRHDYVLGDYCFKYGGIWQYYTNKNGHREPLFEGDIVSNHTWSLTGDTLLIMGGIKMDVLRFADDTLILRNQTAGDTVLLVRARE